MGRKCPKCGSGSYQKTGIETVCADCGTTLDTILPGESITLPKYIPPPYKATKPKRVPKSKGVRKCLDYGTALDTIPPGYVPPSTKVICKFCNSISTIKYGSPKGRQRYQCRTCNHTFVLNGASPNMRFPRYIVQEAIRLRRSGLTLSQIQNRIYTQHKVSVSGTSLFNWSKEIRLKPRHQNSHIRRDFNNLLTTLSTLDPSLVYRSDVIRHICGYSHRTKLTDTQVVIGGLVERVSGGWKTTKLVHPQGKGGAWIDKSVDTPDGIVMVDKRGVKYRVQSGRKRTGEWRNCIDCGTPIYVRSHRKGPTQGKRCAPCNRKAYLPPVSKRRTNG